MGVALLIENKGMKKYLFSLLILLSFTGAEASQELTLYFIPSPVGMDWTSPSSLARSALMNKISFKPRFMGHVFVELKCANEHELTGMVGKNFDYLNQLLVNQRGLGILFHSFDGQLENKEDIEKELSEYYKTGHANFLKVILNENQCERALTYLKEYRKQNVGRHYGLANRPRHGEGAGCSAFGASFLDVLNLIDEDMRQSWSQTVNIPLEYAGPPLKEEGVNLLSVMLNAGSWAKENEKHQKLTFWDPDRMHQWITKKAATNSQNYTVIKNQNSVGIVIDKSHVPAPEEPIWLQKVGADGKTVVKE